MSERIPSLLGLGVYSVQEAARLTRIPARTIRRWVTGYAYHRGGALHTSPPLWHQQIPSIEGVPALTFRDLLEVRFVQYFRAHGVGWKTIRRAADCAAELVQDTHPFSTSRFKTDGQTIFADIIQTTGEASLLDLAQRQYNFKSFVEPYLFDGVEFSDLGILPVRWWPLGRERRVTIDPERAFGQPICDPESVPTSVLASAFKAEGSIDAVSRWYMVAREAVEDAVEFENHLSQAA